MTSMTSLATKSGIRSLVNDQLYISRLVLIRLLEIDEVREFLAKRCDFARIEDIAAELFDIYNTMAEEAEENELFGINESE